MTEQYFFMVLTAATLIIIIVGWAILKLSGIYVFPKPKQPKSAQNPKQTKPLTSEIKTTEPVTKPIDYGEYKIDDAAMDQARHELTTVKFSGGKK